MRGALAEPRSTLCAGMSEEQDSKLVVQFGGGNYNVFREEFRCYVLS